MTEYVTAECSGFWRGNLRGPSSFLADQTQQKKSIRDRFHSKHFYRWDRGEQENHGTAFEKRRSWLGGSRGSERSPHHLN